MAAKNLGKKLSNLNYSGIRSIIDVSYFNDDTLIPKHWSIFFFKWKLFLPDKFETKVSDPLSIVYNAMHAINKSY